MTPPNDYRVQYVTHAMQAEEVQAWLEDPTPSTRDMLLVVPDVFSHDTSMYIAVPERIAWQTPDCGDENGNESDDGNVQELRTIAIGQLLIVAVFCIYVVGGVIQSLLDLYWARKD